MTRDELIYKTLERIQDRIKDRMKEMGINATGSASQSLRIKGNELLGNDYIYFLDKGRKPGIFPPVENIQEWVRQKLGVEEKEVNGVAYVIGRKIANEGTEIFKDTSKGLQLDKIIAEEIDEMMKQLPSILKAEALTFLKNVS